LELYSLTITEVRDLLDRKEISVHDLVRSIYGRIRAVEDKVKAFVTLTEDLAMQLSDKIQKNTERENPKAQLLQGIPLAIKDNICTKGILTTCSSKILSNFIPPYESTVTSRLTEQGYILIGKTNMDEFAMGSSTENSGFYVTRNPWDLERIPGGSSGGSAAAVAADECIAALGSDTGGSVRQPAAFCGVVGLKPTYGRVSRYGLVAFASSLDQIGTLTKTVKDSAQLMNVISGHDPLDSTSAPLPVPDYTAALGQDIKGITFGVPKEYFIEGIEKEVEASVRDAIRKLEALGAIPVEISLPHTGYAIAAYYIIATSEASSNLARYDGVKYGFRAEGKDLMDMYMNTRAQGFGRNKEKNHARHLCSSSGYYEAYYKKAQQVGPL
jgi:aspartyl-tRNA(Asn)/glutamyl-tRNA(Gln) amidotransferase subunit A